MYIPVSIRMIWLPEAHISETRRCCDVNSPTVYSQQQTATHVCSHIFTTAYHRVPTTVFANIASNRDKNIPSARSRGFRPINTLASPKKPGFQDTPPYDEILFPSDVDEEWDLADAKEMVNERNNAYTPGSTQNASPLKLAPKSTGLSDPDRRPLANISAKMQSSSPKEAPGSGQNTAANDILSLPEFGKASPLRNPLRRPQPNVFIPKPRVQKPSTAAQGSNNATAKPPAPGFYLPGQRQVSATSSSLAFMQDYDDDRAPPRPQPITMPTNQAFKTIPPAPLPTFSSAGSTYVVQTRPFTSVNKTHTGPSDDQHDEVFDLDTAVREESRKFGAPDPYMYMDSSQANENLKNLLEGAFDDDDDKPKTRLRKRAKKAAAEGKTSEAKGLAAKLAELSVKAETQKPAVEADEEEEEEEDDGTVEGLNVKLLPHQVEGVSWMIEKESGWRKQKGILPHGGILADDMGLGKTVQSVALMLTNARPALDAKPEHTKQKLPGKAVGKGTLVVAPLALIKQWESEIKTKVAKSHALSVLVHHGPNRTKSPEKLKKYDVVITTYQTLTSEHAGSNMDHAEGAKIGCFGVHWYRIMLDEAHSIKNRLAKSSLACCALNSWYRWCLTGTPMQNNLDELQSLIKFLRLKPLCELSEWKRTITGPMKNGRGGLAMVRLQSFLRIFMKRRTKDILKEAGALSFGGKPTEGSGPKQDSMQIVKREVIPIECDFDEAEQEFYDSLQARADARLEALERSGETNYMGALVLLLRLRQVCDHPNLIEQAMLKDRDAISLGGLPTSHGPSTDMDDLAALMGGISVLSKRCEVCQVTLSAVESSNGDTRCGECETMLRKGKSSKRAKKTKGRKNQLRMKKEKPAERKRYRLSNDSDEEDQGEWIADGPEQRINLGKAGGSDDEDAEGGGESLDSIDSARSDDDDDGETDSPSRARNRDVKIKSERRADDGSEDNDETTSGDDEDGDDDQSDDSNILDGIQIGSVTSKHKPSTKVRHLLRILHTETPEHKTIVFSQFTSMLDLIEPHLKASNLRFVRYDGSMRNDAREAALHSLRTDKKTRVLLCSLKCGSLGLNLTAASRVVILEPFWNPFVEEQAIDRVHRLNQTVDVKVFKLTVKGTVEERILALQDKKRELANTAIEGGKAASKLGLKDILKLFGREAEHGEHTAEDKAIWQKFGESSTQLRTQEDIRSHKPGKQRMYQEHDVYGRRW